MRKRVRVGVLMGGPDAEREVSLASGARVAAALGSHGQFDVADYVVDRPTARELRQLNLDVVFPVLHGPFGEGGPLQAELDDAGLPYVGSDATASRLAMDKCRAKERCVACSIPTPAWEELERGLAGSLKAPLVIKPIADGSSVGIQICRDDNAVANARAELEKTHDQLMTEAFVDGRELTVGIVGNNTLPIIEITTGAEFYDYQAKYHRNDTGYHFDPELPDGVVAACNSHALAAFKELGCRDVARVDFMLRDSEVFFLEINTMPGFTNHSLVPMAAQRSGLSMPELCAQLVGAACARAQIPLTIETDASTNAFVSSQSKP